MFRNALRLQLKFVDLRTNVDNNFLRISREVLEFVKIFRELRKCVKFREILTEEGMHAWFILIPHFADKFRAGNRGRGGDDHPGHRGRGAEDHPGYRGHRHEDR